MPIFEKNIKKDEKDFFITWEELNDLAKKFQNVEFLTSDFQP
jgi:orotate phosphoribosyltransferase-like protein